MEECAAECLVSLGKEDEGPKGQAEWGETTWVLLDQSEMITLGLQLNLQLYVSRDFHR